MVMVPIQAFETFTATLLPQIEASTLSYLGDLHAHQLKLLVSLNKGAAEMDQILSATLPENMPFGWLLAFVAAFCATVAQAIYENRTKSDRTEHQRRGAHCK